MRRLKTMTSIVTSRQFVILLAVGVLVAITLGPRIMVSALHSAAWVNSNVYWQSPADGTAKPTVVGWENECTNTFNDNKASMSGSTQREIVNASAYNQSVWITRSGDPRNVNTSAVTAGANVGMQINDMVFLCAIVTMSASGFGIASDHKVTNTNYPNDRAPVPDSSASQYKVNQASRYESNSYIYAASVSQGPASLVSSPAGQTMGYKRDQNSRYWYDSTPPKFTIKTPTNLASGRYKITVTIEYATIQTYHAYGSDGTSRCVLRTTGDGADVPYGAFSRCERRQANYSFYLNVTAVGPPYDLSPQVTAQIKENGVAIGGNVAQVGDTITYTYAVTNGGGISDGTTTCTLYANSHVGAYDIPNPVEKSSNIAYAPPPTGCPRVFAANSTTTLVTETITVGAGDINHNLCRSLWINPDAPGGVAAGDEVCVAVAAKPYVKVFGGDVTAGNDFGSGCTQNQDAAITGWNKEAAGGYAGAGAQYAAIALAKIVDFSSAQNTGGASEPSGLAFANTGTNSSTFGGSFGSLGSCLPDYYGGKPSTATNVPGPSINLSSLGTGVYSETGNVSISGQINPQQRIVLYVKGDVFIDNNAVNFPGSWSYDKLALFELVVQGNIYVKNSVTQMDGTYIAQPSGGVGGGIYTCATTFAPLALDGSLYNTCNSKLTVNGQFIADQVYLLRTKNSLSDSSPGETNTSNNAAEVFNFTPVNWIAQPPNGSNTNTSTSGKYDAISSLPPVL